MAQLNVWTYLSQITWTIISIGIYSYIMKSTIIPEIIERIKIIRSKTRISALGRNNKSLNNSKYNYQL